MIKENCLVSIITVSYNAVQTIEKTIISVINQTYQDVEYIIIDGGSTDGTIDIIKRYSDKISYWISEPDKGLYDAMNKGILYSTGKWINFMNCGDYFYDNNVLYRIFHNKNYSGIDVLYGNAKIVSPNGSINNFISRTDISRLEYEPIYRHGASFVLSDTHKNFLFNLKKQPEIHYALDFDLIYNLYKANKTFYRIDQYIMYYDEQGISNHPLLNRYYVYKITSESKFSFSKFLYFIICIYNYYKIKIRNLIK